MLGMAYYSDAVNAIGEPAYAGPLFEQLAPWANQWSGTGSNAYVPVSLSLGGLAALLRRYDDAEHYFSAATALADRVGAKFSRTRTDFLWGKMLADRGAPEDADRARELLSTAHTAALSSGYSGIERRAAEVLKLLDR